MGKKITDEDLNVNMSINGINKTQAEISKIQTSIRGLKNEQEDLAASKRKLIVDGKRESQTYKDLTSQQEKNRVAIDGYTKEQKKLQKQLGLTGLTMRQLGKHQKGLKAQMDSFVPNTPEWKKLNNELKETDARLNKVRGEMKQTGGVMGRMQKSLGGFGSLLLGGAGIMAAWNGVKKLVTMNAELSDSQANVRKTTGLTDAAVGQLTKTLKTFNTRTPVTELLALAQEAGRLGKTSVKDIEAFVRTADKISVALGDDLQGDINENVQLIGKLATQYKVGDKYGGDFGKSMERIGSAVNEVAASGANQAGFLVDYLARLSGISNQTNISADDQLGFAAALDEAGQKVEVSGTTMSKIIVDMYKNADEYAQIAGVSTMEFSELLKTDANEALLIFLEGLKGNNEGFEQMTKKMEGLKLEGARSVAVLTSLAANTDNVRAKQAIANKAIIEATSLTEEFNVKNNNLAGNLEKLSNSIGNYFKNSALTGWLTDVTAGFLKLIKVGNEESTLLREQQFQTNILVGSITSLNVENDARGRLIKDLQKTYPDFLGNLNAETVTNTELKDRLTEVNAQYREKIKLAAFGEMIANNQSEAIKLQIEEEEKILDIEKTRQFLNVRPGKDMAETVKNFQTEAKYGNIAAGAALGIKNQYEDILGIRQRLVQLDQEALDLQKKKDKIKLGGETIIQDTVVADPEKTGDDSLKDKEKSLKALDTLQERYTKMEEDRIAVSNEAKAVLEQERAVKEAKDLMASKALIDQITKEHQIKIEEAIVKDKDIKLENIQAFEDRKRELENQIRLQNETDDQAREILAQELQFEKDTEFLEKEMKDIKLAEDQKNLLRALLKEEHEANIGFIEAKHAAIRLQNEKEFNSESIKATEQLEAAKNSAAQQGISVLSGFFNKKSAIYKGLFLMEKGMAIAEVGINTAKSLAAITANTAIANTAAAAAVPLTLGQPWVALNTAAAIKQAAAVKLTSAIQMLSIGASALKGVAGFEDGFYSDVTRTDGKRFNARNMGRSSTQIVNEPSYFSNNGGFLTGEGGPEMIIDTNVFRRLDPKIINNIMNVRDNVKGYESGSYPGQNGGGSSDPELKAMLATLINRFSEPIMAKMVYGYDDENARQVLQNEITASKNNGKLTQ